MQDGGKLLLRLLLGGIILLHGIAKLAHGADFILGMVETHGLPRMLGYLVYVGEVLAPALLIIGLWTRLAALVVAINMVVALYLVHVNQLFALNQSGGWAIELQAMFLFTALAIAMLGAGRYSVGGPGGRYN